MDIVEEKKLSKIGQTDYVQNGELHVGGSSPSVMVTEEADLKKLPDIYKPGTIGYTAGFKKMWQLRADGEWEPIV